MRIRKNDKVKILAGKDKGKEGTVMKVIPSEEKVTVEGVNIVKKHVKPGTISKEGGIISMEKPISASNVMVINSKSKKPEKIGFKFEEGKKVRYFKKTGNVLK